MFRQSWAIFVVVIGLAAPGCDRGDQKSAAGPATRPSQPTITEPDEPFAIEPTTAPTTQSLASELMIDGSPVKFPAAQLRVSKVNGRVVARLFTADPKSALRDDYQGNSYYLVMNLDDIHDPQMVYTSQWQFKSQTRELDDPLHGIFLEGSRQQLQPVNVSVRFRGDPLLVWIDIEGDFLRFDTSPDSSAQPKSVYVKGTLLAPVESKD